MSRENLKEKFRRYWIGKKPSVKKAVEAFISSEGNKNFVELAKEFNVSSAIIGYHVRKLRELGIIKTPKKQFCVLCGTQLEHKKDVFFNIVDRFSERKAPYGYSRGITVGFICLSCGIKLGLKPTSFSLSFLHRPKIKQFAESYQQKLLELKRREKT